MSQIKTRLIFNRFLTCEQAPEWGIARRQKSNIPYRSPLADFFFRPRQNIMGYLPEGLFNLEAQQLEDIQRGVLNGDGDHFES